MIIEFALGLLAFGASGCSQEKEKKVEGAKGLIDIPPPTRTPSTTPISKPERSQYFPPAKASVPQSVSSGIIYHPQFRDGAVDIRKSFPVGLQCVKNEERCYFALGASIDSFPTAEVTKPGPLPVEEEAQLSPEVNEQTAQVTSFLYQDGNFYALFDSFEGGFNQGTPKSGIAIRDNMGAALETFYFSDVMGKPVSCPKGLFYYPNPFSGEEEIWVAAANCEGTDRFREGNVFILSKNADGTLKETERDPLITTQVNPQAIAGLNVGEKVYALVVNTGGTAHTTPGAQADRIVSEGGVDVIDAQTRRFVANIPLGKTAANTITISGDNKIAFLGSQILPEVYALDLEWLGTKLAGLNMEIPVQTWGDVVLAGAGNAIPLNWAENGFYPEMIFDKNNQTLLVSSFNDSNLYPISVPYVAHPGVGLEIKPGFGKAAGSFQCAGPESENCGEVEWIPSGLLAMTGHPAGLTFIPNQDFEGI